MFCCGRNVVLITTGGIFQAVYIAYITPGRLWLLK